MHTRIRKQIIISSVYLLLILLVAWGVFSMLRPAESCADKVKNQNEEAVDCGGVCPACLVAKADPLRTAETGVLPSGLPESYDAWATIENPNHTFGSSKFSYRFEFKDAGGVVIGTAPGMGFILPAEKKYLIAPNVSLSQAPASAGIVISQTDWVELQNYYEKPQLEIVNKNYAETASGTGFSELRGILKNESPFDFEVIKIRIILKDSAGTVIATNATEMRTVKSGEEREFRAAWPARFPGEVRSIEAQPDVNMFDSQSFAKRYVKPEKFQQY